MVSPAVAQRPPQGLSLRWDAVAFMALIHALAALALLPRFQSLPAALTLLALYWVTGCLGVTMGYHRLLAHRSFRVPRWLRNLLATCGALSCQHGPLTWVGLHRHHHHFSDTHHDHHNSRCGFWWSHMGWMLFTTPAMAAVPQFTRDLHNDPWLRFLDRWFLALQLPLAMALYLLGEHLGVGGWSLVLWGIPLRLVAVYHVTWLVNSATHAWGYRSFATDDESRNCWWVALLSFGEGWHNNHHAVPFSARQGLRWFELDLTWQQIRLLQALGLARGVKVAVCEQGSSHGQAVSGGA